MKKQKKIKKKDSLIKGGGGALKSANGKSAISFLNKKK